MDYQLNTRLNGNIAMTSMSVRRCNVTRLCINSFGYRAVRSLWK